LIASPADLIKHALRALSGTKQTEGELGPENCSVGIVGKDEKFRILSKEELASYFVGLFDGNTSDATPMETE
jgi:20S proteasome alpha/beta subunit